MKHAIANFSCLNSRQLLKMISNLFFGFLISFFLPQMAFAGDAIPTVEQESVDDTPLSEEQLERILKMLKEHNKHDKKDKAINELLKPCPYKKCPEFLKPKEMPVPTS